MTLELILFIAAILFGIILYWRESQGNKIYRFFNKLMNSKALQMKPSDDKGFIYQQSFVLRLVFIISFFLLLILISQFLIPINYASISLFASMIFGTLIGSYIAGLIFKSSEIIEEQADSIEDKFHEVVEKGKDLMEDFQTKEAVVLDSKTELEEPKEQEKSARERLKDKGLL